MPRARSIKARVKQSESTLVALETQLRVAQLRVEETLVMIEAEKRYIEILDKILQK